MNTEVTIHEELKQISPLVASINKLQVYSVPDQYFSDLANDIIQHIKTQELLENAKPQANIFSTPEHYFEGFAANLMQRIKQEERVENEVYTELASVAPLLNTISKEPVYTVPEGYFSKAIASAPATPKVGKVVSISSYKRVMKYAVAAVFIGLLVITAFLFTGKKDKEQALGFTPGKEQVGNVASAIKDLSDEEIMKHLDDNSVSIEVNISSIIPETEEEIEYFIRNMSEEEIKEYLKENPETGKAIRKDS